ncbi:MAG: AAA family ATPase, partial [Desulfarculus sp.]|nr:AAA family ATPase [Desulfarculus sp.]
MFTETARRIVDLAKDHAHGQGSQDVDLPHLLAAVAGDVSCCLRLAQCLTEGDAGRLRQTLPAWSSPLANGQAMPPSPALREVLAVALDLASGTGVPDHAHPGLVDARHLICALAAAPGVGELLGGLKPLERPRQIDILAQWYQEGMGDPQALAELVGRLRSLRDDLLAKVFGQDHAILAFEEGLYHSQCAVLADQERRRPSAVFLFAGPPGVGKTYLAELAAARLERPFKRFDMTGYSDNLAFQQMVGYAASYRGAGPGALTGFVARNPDAVLLFDEIEKANLTTVQLFYQVLDAGLLEDKFTEQAVGFRDTVIIFTTNAGASLYDNPNRAGIGRLHSTYHKQTLLGALMHEKNPATGQPAFPQAICSRLSQGYPILFSPLGINELEQVAKAGLNRAKRLLERQYLKEISFDPLVSMALVLREGPGTDARQVTAEADKFLKGELFAYCGLFAPKNLGAAFARFDGIHVEVDPQARLLEGPAGDIFGQAPRPAILLVAEEGFCQACREHLPEVDWQSAQGAGETLDILAARRLDLVILDLWLPARGGPAPSYDLSGTLYQGQDYVPLSSRALESGRGVLRAIHEHYPEVPVYLLSRPEDQAAGGGQPGLGGSFYLDASLSLQGPEPLEQARRVVDQELFLACVRAGGARGIITSDYRGPGQGDRQALLESLRLVAWRLGREAAARALARERKVLGFSAAPALESSQRRLVIKLRDFGLGRAVEAADVGQLVEDVSRPEVSFEDVIGAQEAKEALGFVVDWLRDPGRYQALGIRPPRGVLLTGPPGTGKTLLARAVAGESDCAFLERAASSFVTIWQGSGPQNVRELFERARRYAPAVVFLDEIDALGLRRAGLGGAARAQEETLAALLTEMDGFGSKKAPPVIVLAATNLAAQLDDALKRRFDREVEVELPDRRARLEFLRRALAGREQPLVGPETLERLAGQSAGMSLAELERVMQEASVRAAQEGQRLDDGLLEEAFEKLRMGRARHNQDPEVLLRVARHEAGHALLAWLGGRPPVQVTIVGRGAAGGYMEREVEEERLIHSKPELEQHLREALAGRAAELLYYGAEEGLSTGASGDLRQASQLARRMVGDLGMDPQVGLLTQPEGQAGGWAGQAVEAADRAARRLLQTQFERAQELLAANRVMLD